ncbi:NAD(P)H-dependent FMN reductase [Pontibacter aydingkolensis]|uniref:NAD(P)H-dependent oxidoreductase n=1 Tax=Pontibacter aydingkolensis TaxID=1911536 RepID=A0ABS7CWE8_9BACT|nr:NAD(P)H-dependent oxidoreductase [Pontibacter aydingkolensis]MBW7468127.1 NAD(P)H-dependent oxidoreductase [Pontibacter aydingkolensis]
MITLISGTNRPESNSRAVVNIYADLLSKRNITYQILDLAELPADFTTSALYDNIGKNKSFNKLANMIASSDKFVFVVPEYNSSFPGVLKAFIDGLEYPNTFRDKKGALLGISSGMQGSGLSLSHLTDILNYLGMHIMAMKPKFAHIEKNFDGVKLTNELYQELLEQHVDQFIRF